jgi:hypothetical protein
MLLPQTAINRVQRNSMITIILQKSRINVENNIMFLDPPGNVVRRERVLA